MLVRNKIFWIMTLVFLGAALSVTWLTYPSLLRQLQANRAQGVTLNQTLDQQKQYAALVKSLSAEEKTVNELYQSAQYALPATTSGEILLLQLDGLLNSIKLGSATITAPFATAVPAPAAASTDASGVKPSTQGGNNPTTTPVVKSGAQGLTNFTIVAETDFGTLKVLIEKLRHMARWNKITSVDVTVTGDKMTATIISQIFTKPDATKEFSSTDPQFLTKAKELFSSFVSYTTVPDASKEGNYGRSNPFSPL